MSYILDAIRKSEHERQMRETPTLSALPSVPPQSPPRPTWFWPVIILMSLNLVALAFWFSYKNNTIPGSEVEITATPQTAPQTPAQKAIRLEPKQQPKLGIVNNPAPAAVTKQRTIAEKHTQSIADMLPPPSPVAKPRPIQAKPEPFAKKRVATQTKTPKPEVTKPTVSKAQKPASTIPYLHTLSQDFQNRVPPLKMNIHMFSDNSQDSFAIINMTKYRTGATLSEGLKLEAITRKGLILSFEDQRFQLNHP